MTGLIGKDLSPLAKVSHNHAKGSAVESLKFLEKPLGLFNLKPPTNGYEPEDFLIAPVPKALKNQKTCVKQVDDFIQDTVSTLEKPESHHDNALECERLTYRYSKDMSLRIYNWNIGDKSFHIDGRNSLSSIHINPKGKVIIMTRANIDDGNKYEIEFEAGEKIPFDLNVLLSDDMEKIGEAFGKLKK